MGMDIWKCMYKNLYGHITEKEMDFIENYFDKSDDGTFYLDSEVSLDEIVAKAKEDKVAISEDVIESLRKAIKQEKSSMSFVIF